MTLDPGRMERARQKTGELTAKARKAKAGLPGRKPVVRFLVGIPLFLLAFGVLVGLSVLLRATGLWGDLAFAVLVTTAVLWALYRAAKPLVGREFWALPRAAAMTLTVLVGGPVALATWPLGTALLAAPILAWGIAYLVVRIRGRDRPQGTDPPTLPLPLWIAALVGLTAALLVVALRPSLAPTDRVPRAVPAARADAADADLAERFRPFLFFDSGELRYPLDVEDAIAAGRISMCVRAVRGEECRLLEAAAQIDDSFDYLDVGDAPAPRRGGDAGSAYYYHVVREGETVLVDYWWFYSRNPSPVAGEVFCGPGLRTPPFTCQDHAGDWEGLTVVLEPCGGESETCVRAGGELLEPESVRYAQHAHVVEYAWAELEERWAGLPRPTSDALAPVWEEAVLPAAADHGPRPLAFVARNSHATYPGVCFSRCRQVASDLPEARHDGGQPWTHNAECDGCLKPLPLTPGGEPALWNAFSGRWGRQRCILGGAYCDLSAAPRGPSLQARYRDPSGDGEA